MRSCHNLIRFFVCIVGIFLFTGCGWHLVNRPKPLVIDLGQRVYPEIKGCYAIERADHKYFSPDGSGYVFNGKGLTHSETAFYFQPVPGSSTDYYVLDRDANGTSLFLGATPYGALTRESARSQETRWKLQRTEKLAQYPWKLVSVPHGKPEWAQTNHKDQTWPYVVEASPNLLHVALVEHKRCLQRPDDPQGSLGLAGYKDQNPEMMASPGKPIWGFADVHNHMFAQLAFGGAIYLEPAVSQNFFAEAFPACWDVHSFIHIFDFPETQGSPANRTHSNSGYPSMAGYPQWYTMDHQQVYYRWLERAYYGGLRLMTMLAVNNEVLCGIWSATHTTLQGCDDMEAAHKQIDAAYELQRFIDSMHGGEGKGWFRIVTNAHDAREVMEDGKLAVVLGIEVSNLFGCSNNNCSIDSIEKKEIIDNGIKDLYTRGVRHVFLVHEFDNDFAGASMFHPPLSIANYLATGEHFDAEDCSNEKEPYGYQYSFWPTLPYRLISILEETLRLSPLRLITAGILDTHYEPPSWSVLRAPMLLWPTPFYSAEAHCNRRGLTKEGEYLLGQLMAHHMIIDVDHMSKNAVNRTIEIAETKGYPLVSGHSKFLTLKTGSERTEFTRTEDQIKKIRQLGGIVAPMLAASPRSENSTLQQLERIGEFPPRGTDRKDVIFDCSYSSQEWAQKYLYAVDRMSEESTMPAVAFGSDFNGFTDHIGPRFGNDGCFSDKDADRKPQENPVIYPFGAVGISDERGQNIKFDRLTTGTRVWDYNVDGLAHIGLVPDFIQDLRNVNLTDDDLKPLFRSAESYVSMWQCIEDESKRRQHGCRRPQTPAP